MEAENIKDAEKKKSCDSIKMMLTLGVIQLGSMLRTLWFLFPNFRKKEIRDNNKKCRVGV